VIGFVLGQGELDRGLDTVDGPGEPQGALADVQHTLVRLGAVGGVAAPELVPVRQRHLGVLGQPHAQRGGVGQRGVHRLRRRRHDRAQAQLIQLCHRDLLRCW
jgi:hypothetical protein